MPSIQPDPQSPTCAVNHGDTRAQQDLTRASRLRDLQAAMARIGWQIGYLDLDLTRDPPTLEIRCRRFDGRMLFARCDRLGRGVIERSQRGVILERPGRHEPQAPRVVDSFLGRQRVMGPRALLRSLTRYIADNADAPASIADVRAAWAGVMSGPVMLAGPR